MNELLSFLVQVAAKVDEAEHFEIRSAIEEHRQIVELSQRGE